MMIGADGVSAPCVEDMLGRCCFRLALELSKIAIDLYIRYCYCSRLFGDPADMALKCCNSSLSPYHP